MTKKRSHKAPVPNRGVDRAFKTALTLLILTALAVTFWPRSPSPAPVAGASTTAAAGSQPDAALPAPSAPAAPAAATVDLADGTRLDEQADAALMEQLLVSGDVPELTQFGSRLMDRRDHTNAVRIFRRAVELDAESEINHFNLGMAHARLQQTNEAIAQFRAALEIYPDYADAHNSLGLQLAALGDLAAAEKHYRHAIEVDPESAVALNNLGTVLARKREYEYAITWFEKAVALETNYVDARFNLANALLLTGRTNEAMARLLDIVNEFPDHRPAQLVLTRLMSAEAKR